MINYQRVGAGEPLVLIHGIGASCRVWRPVLGRLAIERDVIAVDLPGYGESPRSALGSGSGAAALANGLDEMLDRLQLAAVHLAGNSMGGWVALELAKRGRALSVTLLSPAGFYNVAEAAFVWASLWVSVRGARVLTNHAERVMSSKLRQSLLLAQFLGAPWKVSSVDAARMLMDLAACEGFDLDLPAIIRQRFIYAPGFSAPVTIAWGARDRLLFSRQQRRAAEEIPGSRMIRMPRVGHVPMHDDPALVADLLLRGSAPTGRPQL